MRPQILTQIPDSHYLINHQVPETPSIDASSHSHARHENLLPLTQPMIHFGEQTPRHCPTPKRHDPKMPENPPNPLHPSPINPHTFHETTNLLDYNILYQPPKIINP